MANLFGSICLSDIPKELIQTSQSNGKKYLTICINEKKQVDEYGNTHYVKVYQKRDPANPVQAEVYLGNMKATEYGQQAQGQQPAIVASSNTNVGGGAALQPQADGELPF